MSTEFNINREYTSAEYNAENKYQLLKTLNKDLRSPHQNYTWIPKQVNSLKVGEPWNPSGSCKGGGLYFCNNFKDLSSYKSQLICLVSVPDDARVWVEIGKAKTNLLFLKEVYTNLEFVKNYFNNTLPLDKPLTDTDHLYTFVEQRECVDVLLFLHSHPQFATNTEMQIFFDKLFADMIHLFDEDEVYKLESIIVTRVSTLSIFIKVKFFVHGLLQNIEATIIQEIGKTEDRELCLIIHSRWFADCQSDAMMDAIVQRLAKEATDIWDVVSACTNKILVQKIIASRSIFKNVCKNGQTNSEIVRKLLMRVTRSYSDIAVNTQIIDVCLMFVAGENKKSGCFAQMVKILKEKKFPKDKFLALVANSQILTAAQKMIVYKIIEDNRWQYGRW